MASKKVTRKVLQSKTPAKASGGKKRPTPATKRNVRKKIQDGSDKSPEKVVKSPQKSTTPKKGKKSPVKDSTSKTMVTIHDNDLMTVIKTEPEETNEEQLSQIFCEKSNPAGLPAEMEIDVLQEDVTTQSEDTPSVKEKEDCVCKICEKRLASTQSLKMHYRNCHSDEKRFKCKHCSTSFMSVAALKSHEAKMSVCDQCNGLRICGPYNFEKHRNEHDSVTFKCQLCPEIFYHKKDLRGHEETHKTAEVIKVYSCVGCGKLFASDLSASACARMHTHSYECKICKLSCRTPAELRRHEETHDSTKKYECKYCSAFLKSAASLKLHVNDQHKRPSERIIPCTFEGCEKKFFTMKQRTCHEISTHKPKNFTCLFCESKFPTQSRLSSHMSEKHEADGSPRKTADSKNLSKVVCKICDKVLASKYYLKVHMNQHNDLKTFKCEDCGKSFSRKWVLQTHKKTIHMGDESRTHRCDSCPASFVNVSQLNYHVKMYHTDENAGSNGFPCPIEGCDHLAKTKGQLDAHLKSLKHSDEKKFQCPVCKMFFTRKWVMEEHIARRHEDTRRQMNFKCLLCGRGFYYQKSYIRHSGFKHTQACEFCDLSFVTTRYHMDHRRAVHGIVEKLEPDAKWSPCHICGKLLGGPRKLKKHINLEHSDVNVTEFLGTFEENNDDPDVILNFRKKKLKIKKETNQSLKKKSKKMKK